MAIRLPPPPKVSDLTELAQWFESLWRRVSGAVVTTGDANATIGSGETYHGISALSSARTITLPASESLQDGDEIIIQNETSNGSTVTIARQGSDTINGATSVSASGAYFRKRIIKRGAGKFYSA